MPTYQYRCTECAAELEAFQKFTDAALTECPDCTGALRKVYSAVGVVFKGSGFYATDNRTKGKANASVSGSSSSDSGSSSSGSSGSSGSSDSSGSGSTASAASTSSSTAGSGESKSAAPRKAAASTAS